MFPKVFKLCAYISLLYVAALNSSIIKKMGYCVSCLLIICITVWSIFYSLQEWRKTNEKDQSLQKPLLCQLLLCSHWIWMGQGSPLYSQQQNNWSGSQSFYARTYCSRHCELHVQVYHLINSLFTVHYWVFKLNILYVFLFFWLQLNILVFPPLIEYILKVVHTPQNLWDLWCILQCFCISYFTSLPCCHHNTFHFVNATPKDGCSLFFSFPPHLPHSLSVAPLVYLLIDDPALSSWQHSSKLVFPISLVLPPGQALNLLLLVTMPPQYLIPILHLIKSPCSIIWRTQHPYHIGVYSLSCFDYMLLWCPMMYDVAPTEHQRS